MLCSQNDKLTVHIFVCFYLYVCFIEYLFNYQIINLLIHWIIICLSICSFSQSVNHSYFIYLFVCLLQWNEPISKLLLENCYKLMHEKITRSPKFSQAPKKIFHMNFINFKDYIHKICRPVNYTHVLSQELNLKMLLHTFPHLQLDALWCQWTFLHINQCSSSQANFDHGVAPWFDHKEKTKSLR